MIDALTAGTFTRHMVAHTALVALVAPLLAAVIARSRVNPVAWRPQWFSPIAASLIEFVVIWGWHAPALHVLARHDRGALALEQMSFLGASTYLWLAILGVTNVVASLAVGLLAKRHAPAMLLAVVHVQRHDRPFLEVGLHQDLLAARDRLARHHLGYLVERQIFPPKQRRVRRHRSVMEREQYRRGRRNRRW